jgi:hypothetical protein
MNVNNEVVADYSLGAGEVSPPFQLSGSALELQVIGAGAVALEVTNAADVPTSWIQVVAQAGDGRASGASSSAFGRLVFGGAARAIVACADSGAGGGGGGGGASATELTQAAILAKLPSPTRAIQTILAGVTVPTVSPVFESLNDRIPDIHAGCVHATAAAFVLEIEGSNVNTGPWAPVATIEAPADAGTNAPVEAGGSTSLVTYAFWRTRCVSVQGTLTVTGSF